MTLTRDVIGYGRDYPRIAWPDEARIAVSLVVHFEEGAERTPLEGDAEAESATEGVVTEGTRRDLMVESMYEYGPRRGFWRLMEILDRHGVKATFFCSGQALERNPVAAREITARGHEACGHGYRWIPSEGLGRAEERADIQHAVQAVHATTGERPLGWNSRVPSVQTRELLLEAGGFLYDSDSYADDLPYFVEVSGRRFLTIPYSLEINDEKFWSIPHVAGFTKPDDFFAVMQGTFDRLYAEGATHPKMMSVGIHLRIAGRPTRAGQVERFIRYAKGWPGVWFARRIDIARWWLERYADRGGAPGPRPASQAGVPVAAARAPDAPALRRDFVGYGNDYPRIAWPGDARLALSLVVNFEEGSERSPLYGDLVAEPTGEGFLVPAGRRDLRNESFFDYGSRVGIWRLLEIFSRYDVRVTFFACGMALEMNPEAAREITARGHEACGHGYRWHPIYLLNREEEREFIRKDVEAITRTTGQRPLGWFSRGPSEHTRDLLIEEAGFLYDCDSFADDLPYFVEVRGKKWLIVPYSLETNDMKFWRVPGYSEPGDFLRQLKAAFDCLYAEGATHPKMMSVGLHMRHTGRPARANALEEFIRYAKAFPGVWFARRTDIARWWLDHYGHLPALPQRAP